MAVSMNTGGSGYMRSDFMISDAAIPLRVEESMEQAENSGQFSKVLSGIGEAKKAVSAEASSGNTPVAEKGPTKVAEQASKDIPKDFHQLAEAVANGEIKLEDIPEELLKQDMFAELTKLVGSAEKPELKQELQDISKDPAAQELLAELAAMLSAQQTTITPDDKTDELSALTVQQEITDISAIADTSGIPELSDNVQVTQIAEKAADIKTADVEPLQAVEVQQTAQETLEQIRQSVIQQEAAQAVDAAQTAETSAEAAQISETSAEAAPEVIAPQENPADTAAPAKAENSVKQEKSEQAAEQSTSEAAESAAVQQTSEKFGWNTEQQSDNSAESGFAAKAKAPKDQTDTKPEEFSRLREDISRAEVRTVRKAPEKTEQAEQAEQTDQPMIPQQHVQRSRVISKSDELEMIRSSADAKPTEENAAQTMVQPQTVTAEKSVIFTRADGEEIPVKPSEVAQQVADRLTERTETLSEGETEYSVTLHPEDLGRITVRMTKTADGAVSVSIAAENSRTLKIIEDNGAAIQDTLKQNGVQLESWQTVGESRQETHAEDYQGSSKNPYREAEGRQQEQDSDGESFAEIIASM